ncbi:hypothetical protein LEN26_003240 [Aphanomyces euteiches]|nr:hypothetical protein LEN26_003240 [Aphanomyces euteiches]
MVQIASFAALAAVATLLDVASAAASLPSGNWPTSLGNVKYSAPFVVKAGTVFDGQMKTYERSNAPCKGQAEGGKDLAVFLVEPGATLKNVIIGANQREGVHCESHDCTIENVSIEGFYAQDFGKLYRSRGSCKTQVQRKVTLTNVYAVNPKVTLVGVNKNYNDQAKFSNITIKSSKTPKVCTYFQGGTSGEPKELGNGILAPTCQYSASDIQVAA